MLSAAAWLGLVCGLFEAAWFLLFQQLGWLNWNIAQDGVTEEILWVAPVVNLLLFCVLGAAGIAAMALPPPLRIHRRFILGALSFLLFLNWLALSGRIRMSSVLILAVGLAVVFARWLAPREEAVLRWFRRTLPALVTLVLLVYLGLTLGQRFLESRALAQLPPARPDAPNILVIVVDTLRADHLSAYGYKRPTSPHLDALAAQGVLFEKAISTSSWTLPAHISLLTGRYPYEAKEAYDRLHPELPTLAEHFRAQGYRTGAFSDNLFYFTRRQGFGRGFIRFEDFFQSWRDGLARTLFGRKFVKMVLPRLGYQDLFWRKRATAITDHAARWILSHERPFFAILNYFDAHDPYLPPEPFRSKFSAPGYPGGKLHAEKNRRVEQFTPQELQGEVDAYDGAIAFVDENIGRLLQILEDGGRGQNTVVVVVSDHGEMFGEHQLLLHQNCLYRPVIHVPLVMRWPGKIPAGIRVSMPVSIASIPATLTELAGSGAGFPRPSLVRLWQEHGSSAPLELPMAETGATPYEQMRHEPTYHGAIRSLVSPEWHFIEHQKLGPQLFHWQNDPFESSDLAGTADGKAVVSFFADELKRRRAEPGRP